MELIGRCELMGYTVEAYFPERGMEDLWTIWVVKDGRVVEEATVRIEVTSVHGIDQATMDLLDRVAVAAVERVERREEARRLAGRRDEVRAAA
jgi:hypothetical protein